MNDLDLLRTYEPVIYYTHGEMFFPCAVEGYVQRCSLWMRDLQGNDREVVSEEAMTLDTLANYDQTPPGSYLYLRFVKDPMNGLEYQSWLNREGHPVFSAPGRLARVGVASRVVDSLFDLSRLLRGTVPQGTAAAAEVQYRNMRLVDDRYVYYGRVLREKGYIILHYMFFYVMNDWRTTFYGVNDHEADWEQIFVYLSDEDEPQPLWVSYALHDYYGDDLRRRWDDPSLHRFGTHPIVYAGAGSHASYFLPGEYLTNVQLQIIKPAFRAFEAVNSFWRKQLGQGILEPENERRLREFFSIPFVDYARGDGIAIGPGQVRQWTPVLFTDDMDWVHHYRGLWGLDTQDPLGGERAPGGPKYNRDGTVRFAWHNPLGWSGLHKVAPPQVAEERLAQRIKTLEAEMTALKAEISRESEALRMVDLEVRALKETEYLDPLFKARTDDLEAGERHLNNLYERHAELEDTLLACHLHLSRIEVRNYGDPQAHLQHKATPELPIQNRNQIIELWAALSSAFLVLIFALSIIFNPANLLLTTAFSVVVVIFIESMLRGRITRLLLNITLFLAVVTAGVLVLEFFWLIVFIAAAGGAWLLVTQNLRELRNR